MAVSNNKQCLQTVSGPVFSIVTPFDPIDDSIDYPTLERYINRIYEAGGRNFYVMGYNSRFSELSWSEIRELNTFVTKVVKGIDPSALVIVADPLHCSTKTSIEFARQAELIGADMISLVFREKFYSEEQVYRHFNMISESTNIGLLIHEMPFISGHGGHTVDWPVSLLDRIADIENVVAIKEDAKNDDYSKQVVATLKDRLSIVISGGGKRQWLRFADKGCQAWLNGIGVFEPRLAVRFWHAKKRGDQEYINGLIQEIEVPFFEKVVSRFGWHLGIKAALEVQGHMSRHERMPLLALNSEEAAYVKSVMESLPIAKYV